MDNFVLLIFGVFNYIIVIVNLMENIRAIHSYNRRKVKKEVFASTFRSKNAVSCIVIPALVISVGFFLYAQFKYNKVLF